MTAQSRWASAKAQTFQESVIREMSRLCAASGGVNLAQGFPDFPCPQELKDAAKQAIDDDVNQYAITWGAKAFRDGIAATGDVDPMVLFSKAGHDAMAVAELTEWAMLFVRCGNGGISHHPDEIVTMADVAVALDAFEAAVQAIAAAHPVAGEPLRQGQDPQGGVGVGAERCRGVGDLAERLDDHGLGELPAARDDGRHGVHLAADDVEQAVGGAGPARRDVLERVTERSAVPSGPHGGSVAARSRFRYLK